MTSHDVTIHHQFGHFNFGIPWPISVNVMNRSHFASICLCTLGVLLFMGILAYCNSLFKHPGSVYPVCHALIFRIQSDVCCVPQMMDVLLPAANPRNLGSSTPVTRDVRIGQPLCLLAHQQVVSLFSCPVFGSAEYEPKSHHFQKAI